MTFHLYESGLFIGLATDLSKVLNGWDTLFRILKLGSNPKGCATNELVVFDVDDTTGDIAIYDVESEIEGLGPKAKCKVDFDKKVDEAGAHVPPNFGLLIHRLSGGHRETLMGCSNKAEHQVLTWEIQSER
jgi:hypothetical protein